MLLRRVGDWEGVQSSSDGPDQLENIVPMHEASILSAIRRRFRNGKAFTGCGPTLVAVNPYKELPGVLSDDTAATYRDRSVQELEATPPHLYAVVVSRVTITICMFEWVGDEATVSHSRRSTTA